MDEPTGQENQGKPDSDSQEKNLEAANLPTVEGKNLNVKNTNSHGKDPHNKDNPSSNSGFWKKFFKETKITDWIMVTATIVIAASTTIYTCYARKQWEVMSRTLQEMHTATEAAKKSADAAEETLKQNKDFAYSTLHEMGMQSQAMQDAAGATKSQLTIMQKQLELTDRPWITVNPSVAGFSFNNDGNAFLFLQIQLQNIGHSVATGIGFHAEIFPYSFQKNEFWQANTRQKEICDRAETIYNDPSKYGVTLFPSETATMSMSTGMNKEAMNAAIIPNSGNFIAPIIVGCAVYSFPTSSKYHHTRFIYELRRMNLVTPTHPLNIEIGKSIPVSDILLERYFFGGASAD